MNERGDNRQSYIDGRFGLLAGEAIPIEKIKKANRLLQEKRSGKGEDGVISIDDTEGDIEEKAAVGTNIEQP